MDRHGPRSSRGTDVATLFYAHLENARLAGVSPKAFLRAATIPVLPVRAPARDRGRARVDPQRRLGGGNYFRTGNASERFNQRDGYVWSRLKALRIERKGRNLKAGEAERWTRDSFEELGLHRLRGSIRYPERPFWKGAA
jgi:hypothetical protein